MCGFRAMAAQSSTLLATVAVSFAIAICVYCRRASVAFCDDLICFDRDRFP